MSDSKQMPMQTPQDLFVHELSDIRNAEQIIIQMLEEAQGMVQNSQLKDGLRMHAEQSRQQVQRIQQIFDADGRATPPDRVPCCSGVCTRSSRRRSSRTRRPRSWKVSSSAERVRPSITRLPPTPVSSKRRGRWGRPRPRNCSSRTCKEEQQMLQRVEQISQQLTQRMASMNGMQAGSPGERLAQCSRPRSPPCRGIPYGASRLAPFFPLR